MDVEEYKTKLSVVIASRKHSGTYTLKAENSSGRDEATIEVKVLDVPAKPEGPLKVTTFYSFLNYAICFRCQIIGLRVIGFSYG